MESKIIEFSALMWIAWRDLLAWSFLKMRFAENSLEFFGILCYLFIKLIWEEVARWMIFFTCCLLSHCGKAILRSSYYRTLNRCLRCFYLGRPRFIVPLNITLENFILNGNHLLEFLMDIHYGCLKQAKYFW